MSPLSRFRTNALILGALWLFGAISSAKGATVEMQGHDAIFVDGVIDQRTASQISLLLSPNVRRLLIRSEGGRTDVGMDIGALLHERSIAVEVVDYCMSSCANYIFLGAKKKSVKKDSIVIWHGGLTNSRNFEVRELNITERSERLRELVFFATRGISIDIVVYSSILTLGKPTGAFTRHTIAGMETKVAVAIRDYHGWAPSKAELERLGVEGIDDYPAFEKEGIAEQLLKSYGFEGMRIYTGRAYSRLPSGLESW